MVQEWQRRMMAGVEAVVTFVFGAFLLAPLEDHLLEDDGSRFDGILNLLFAEIGLVLLIN